MAAGLEPCTGVAVPNFAHDISGAFPDQAASASEGIRRSLQHAGERHLTKEPLGLAKVECVSNSPCLPQLTPVASVIADSVAPPS